MTAPPPPSRTAPRYWAAAARHAADLAHTAARDAVAAADRAYTVRDYSAGAGHAQKAADLCARAARCFADDARDHAAAAEQIAAAEPASGSMAAEHSYDRARRALKAAEVLETAAVACSASKYEGAADVERRGARDRAAAAKREQKKE